MSSRWPTAASSASSPTMTKPTDPDADPPYGRRLSRLEGQYLVRPHPQTTSPARLLTSPPLPALLQVMQSQMIGMQSSLDRILNAIQSQSQNQAPAQQPPAQHSPLYPGGSSRGSPVLPGPLPPIRARFETHNSHPRQGDGPSRPRTFPPLPGFAPPVCYTPFLVSSSSSFGDGTCKATQVRDIRNRAQHGTLVR